MTDGRFASGRSRGKPPRPALREAVDLFLEKKWLRSSYTTSVDANVNLDLIPHGELSTIARDAEWAAQEQHRFLNLLRMDLLSTFTMGRCTSPTAIWRLASRPEGQSISEQIHEVGIGRLTV